VVLMQIGWSILPAGLGANGPPPRSIWEHFRIQCTTQGGDGRVRSVGVLRMGCCLVGWVCGWMCGCWLLRLSGVCIILVSFQKDSLVLVWDDIGRFAKALFHNHHRLMFINGHSWLLVLQHYFARQRVYFRSPDTWAVSVH
jgi:hypothetical protein